MKKKSILPVLMALFILVSISAKAQSSGPYVFVDGLFKYATTSTKDASQDNKVVSQDELSVAGSIGLGYIFSPNNDGQGISVEAGFEIGTQNNYLFGFAVQQICVNRPLYNRFITTII